MSMRDRETLDMVKDALRRRNVVLAYQPIVNAARPDRPAFYEGLLRVLDPSGRIIPARDFIGAVETHETGRILDCLALELGLAALADNPTLRIAINMSARSIGYARWNAVLEEGLSRDPTTAERLILEITESSAMLMPEIVTAFMADLQGRGIAFALDDFGAGYTAFRYFKEFDFDFVKIDGQFIRGIPHSPDNQVLTRALVSIARHFGMFTIAESVETADEAAFLTALGVDCLQGYHFGAPTIEPVWAEGKTQRRAG
ncbi:MAG: EAL domain-containing protein [Rhodobacteraceae bacterium]|nr:EAL domain-containing protein [Paracoccaceae bacterium]